MITVGVTGFAVKVNKISTLVNGFYPCVQEEYLVPECATEFNCEVTDIHVIGEFMPRAIWVNPLARMCQ